MGIWGDIWGAVSAKGKGKAPSKVLGIDNTQLGGSGQRFDAQGNPNPNGWYGYEDVPGRPGHTFAGLVYLGKPSQAEVKTHVQTIKLWEARKRANLQRAGYFVPQQFTPVAPPVAPKLFQFIPTDTSEGEPGSTSGELDEEPSNLKRNVALGAAAALAILVLSR